MIIFHRPLNTVAILFSKTLLLLALVMLPTLSYATSIKLITGDEIRAEIIEETDTYIKVAHDVLGELNITRNNIISIEGRNQIDSAPVVKDEPKDNGLFGTGILSNWDRNFTLGLNGKEGNSQAFDFHTAFNADYDDDSKRWDLGAEFNFSQQDGETTHDDFNIFATRDWLLPQSQWLYFASGKFDWDEFKSWDYRVTGIAGIGYDFIEKETFSLTGRTGIAGKKNFGSDNDNFEPELMLGFNTDWDISKIQSLVFKTELFIPFERASDFRNLSRLDWKFKLDTSMDLSFKLGLENEYESEVDVNTKHNDFKYRASIVWGL